MNNLWLIIFKISAFILALVFLLALPLALLAFDIGRVVFNPPLVKRVVTDEVVNSDLIPVALEWFSDQIAQERVDSGVALVWIDEPDVVLLMSLLDREDWRGIKNEVLTDKMLASWVSVSVDGVYDWIDSDHRVPQITFNLKPLKDRANSEHGENSIVIAYDNLEPCTQEEINDFLSRLEAAPPDTEVLYNLCEFPQPWHEDQFSDYVESVQQVVSNVPDNYALTEELAKAADDPQGVGPEVLKLQLRFIRIMMKIAWLFPLVLLVLILVLVVRSWKDLGLWWGLPLVVTGFMALLPTVTYRLLITSILVAGPLSETPELIMEEATRSSIRLAAEIFRPLLFQAVVIIAVGLILTLIMLILGTRKTAEKADM